MPQLLLAVADALWRCRSSPVRLVAALPCLQQQRPSAVGWTYGSAFSLLRARFDCPLRCACARFTVYGWLFPSAVGYPRGWLPRFLRLTAFTVYPASGCLGLTCTRQLPRAFPNCRTAAVLSGWHLRWLLLRTPRAALYTTSAAVGSPDARWLLPSVALPALARWLMRAPTFICPLRLIYPVGYL